MKDLTFRIKKNEQTETVSFSIKLTLPKRVYSELELYTQKVDMKLNEFVTGCVQDVLKYDRAFRKYLKDNPDKLQSVEATQDSVKKVKTDHK
jgi:hypothetical protein